MSQKVLLICWDFPPNDGIGGRRWAKFAKQLSLDNYEVFVLKSKNLNPKKKSPWFKDVENRNIKIFEINQHKISKWLHDYSSKFSFLKIRLAQIFFRIRDKGTIFDKAIGIEDEFLSNLKDIIISNEINNVIVSGAPFNLLYYTSKLKGELKNINIIADYRDPWTNSVNYGIRELNKNRLEHELYKQTQVISNVDYVVAPNEFLIEQIRSSQKEIETVNDKFKVITHFYDKDEVVNSTNEEIKKESTFSLLYAGALYTDTIEYQNLLADSILDFMAQNPLIKLKLDIYSIHSTNVFEEKGLGKVVSINKPIGDKVFENINQYDYVIILLAQHNKDFKTTKFYDFLPYKIPYLHIGPVGFVSESIIKDDLGLLIEKKGGLNDAYLSRNKHFTGFDFVEKFELCSVSKNLYSLIK